MALTIRGGGQVSSQHWIRSASLIMLGLGTQAALAATPMRMPASPGVTSSKHAYVVPPITLVDQHGREVRLDQVLAEDKPALVQFFFTSCTTICGVRSAQLVAAAAKLHQAGIDIGFYTITTDPEHDTPPRLLAFSRQFGGAPPANWHLLTGSVDSIRQVQAAFDASDPSADKMMHEPLTFIHGGMNQPWQRIDAVTTTSELAQQIRMDVARAH
jgi:protein SCO1/2